MDLQGARGVVGQGHGKRNLMISRRRLIQAGAAAASCAAIGAGARASSRIISGAIRWDAWYDSEHRAAVEASLGPKAWRFRAPWFSRIVSPSAISIDGNRQSIIDAEIDFASGAGLKYWAYVWYGPNDGMQNAWRLHQASSIKDKMNWCLLWQFTDLGDPSIFAGNIPTYVGYFQQSNYQKTPGGRPLVYLFIDSPLARAKAWGDDWANVQTALDGLRLACTTAGLKNPYIVVMCGAASTAANIKTQLSADAISNYIGLVPRGTPATYDQLDLSVRGYWAAQAATGSPIVPIVMMGWDVRPRKQHPPPWEPGAVPGAGVSSYVQPGTVAQRVDHLRAAVNYVNDNPAICPSTALLIYSWNECDEGGSELCPSLGDPPPSAILAAIKPVLS